MSLRVGSLCSGYEGIGLGLAEVGIMHELVFVADPDPAASKVLAHHFPGVRNLGDISLVDWSGMDRPELLTMGFPCTDVSLAGRGLGIAAGTRSGLWLECARAIDALRPPLVLIENVRGLLSARAHSDVEPCPWCLGDRGGDDQEPCGSCNDSGWRRPWGYRRVLARVLPLCIVWGKWRGLLVPWGTLGGSWPCDGCNPSWIDTWWLPTQIRRFRWWWWRHRWGRPAGNYDDEPPF